MKTKEQNYKKLMRYIRNKYSEETLFLLTDNDLIGFRKMKRKM